MSVKDGNSASISVLVHVDDQLALEESAFEFLVAQVRADMQGQLPSELLSYEEWYRRFALVW